MLLFMVKPRDVSDIFLRDDLLLLIYILIEHMLKLSEVEPVRTCFIL